MGMRWAIDLGTTNTVVAVEEDGGVRAVDLPDISRKLPVEQSPLIPSAVHVSETRGPWYRLWRPEQQVTIGQQALNRNFDGRSPAFAQSFKRSLAGQPHRGVLRTSSGKDYSAREAAYLFCREVLATLKRQFGVKPTDLTIPAPVGYYEHYRAELQNLARRLGIKEFRSLDEPVAAALGYGVNIAREETLLVVDFGGGTLNLAAVRLGHHTTTGAAPVIAKHMVNLGGDDVDRWLVEHLVRAELRELPEWQRDILWEAMWLKERVSREGQGEFRWGGLRRTLTREEMVKILAERGLYQQLTTALHDIQRQLAEDPTLPHTGIDEVLMVGGSTMLPEVPAVVDDVFPQAVVRHDPNYVFTSVALGAARYGSGTPVEDFIYHDYALAVQNEQTHTVDYELIVPRRTRYPTGPLFTVRYYADFAGMNEVRFSVCEVGRLGQTPVDWKERSNGNKYWSPKTETERALVQELNPGDEPLPLRPAGVGTSPRLRVSYFINSDRWLCTTVDDLVRKVTLRENEPVVRLR